MNHLNIISSLFSESVSQTDTNNTNQIIIISFGLVSSVLLLAAFLPQTIHTIKTRNTTSLSTSMFSLVFCARFLFSLSAILLIVRYVLLEDYGIALYASSLPLLICHGINLFLNGIILIFKIYNLKKAKDNNMTEAEWIDHYHFLKEHKKDRSKKI